MSRITDIDTLQNHYGTPSPNAVRKVTPRLTDAYAAWIYHARFCLLGTVGPEGTDVSPRGDDGPVVRVDAPDRLCLPDWHGNNRIDTLRNIVTDGRITCLFMVPGSDNVVRVNGRAWVNVDTGLCDSFARNGRAPRSVLEIEIAEVYFQCARALMRSELWSRDDAAGLPSAGQMIAAATDPDFDAADYDDDWLSRARDTLW